jgi:hypothetical protein
LDNADLLQGMFQSLVERFQLSQDFVLTCLEIREKSNLAGHGNRV